MRLIFLLAVFMCVYGSSSLQSRDIRADTPMEILYLRRKLMQAIGTGNMADVETFLSKLPSIDGIHSDSEYGDTPLTLAVRMNNAALVYRLMSLPSCDINEANSVGDTPLLLAIVLPRIHTRIARHLFDANAKTNIPNVHGLTVDDFPPWILKNGAKGSLQPIIETDVDTINPNHALFLTLVELGDIDRVREIFHRFPTQFSSIDDIRTSSGDTALMVAVSYRFVDLARFLLSQPSVRIETLDSDGRTVLMEAVDRWDLRMIEMLLSAGADLDAVDIENRTVQELINDHGPEFAEDVANIVEKMSMLVKDHKKFPAVPQQYQTQEAEVSEIVGTE